MFPIRRAVAANNEQQNKGAAGRSPDAPNSYLGDEAAYLPSSVQDDTQNLQCFVFVVMPLGFVTHLVSHWPHHFGHVTFAETIKEAPGCMTMGAPVAGNANEPAKKLRVAICSLPILSSSDARGMPSVISRKRGPRTEGSRLAGSSLLAVARQRSRICKKQHPASGLS